jgi:tRNA G18 (ribose-2'-O)-methylase SpoU
MTLKKLRRRLELQKKVVEQRFEKHRRKSLFAEPGVHNFLIVLDNLKPAYNIGKIFRSADAFGAKGVCLVGIDFFDPAPAMGSFKWVPSEFYRQFDDCFNTLENRGYHLFMLEPGNGPLLTEVNLPEKSAFIFGNEEFGFSFDPADYPGISTVQIPQFGKVQSLNVSIAASITMYEYVRQHQVG